MSSPTFTGLFVAEGSSDAPLAAIVESLFLERGFIVRLSAPDFSRLERTPKDVGSRLLLDEQAIRQVAGNPNGRAKLALPTLREVERVADPKTRLRDCLLAASDAVGRRRDMVRNRFPQHRRQLLERLDPNGPVSSLDAWQTLVDAIEQVAGKW